MKYTTGALVIVALLGVTNAIHLKTDHKVKAQFTDDLVKQLTEDMAKDIEAPAAEEEAKAAPAKEEKKEEKKKEAKKEDKKMSKKKPAAKKAEKKAAKKAEKVDDEIPMDAAAIKAYSSVIADAAEDSEPQTPVVYHQVAALDDDVKKPSHANQDVYNPDPMGSMIQNEISSIKDASIKAAKDRDD